MKKLPSLLRLVKALFIVMGLIIIDLLSLILLLTIFMSYRIVVSLIWWVNVQSFKKWVDLRTTYLEKRTIRKAWNKYNKNNQNENKNS